MIFLEKKNNINFILYMPSCFWNPLIMVYFFLFFFFFFFSFFPFSLFHFFFLTTRSEKSFDSKLTQVSNTSNIQRPALVGGCHRARAVAVGPLSSISGKCKARSRASLEVGINFAPNNPNHV